MQLLWRDVKIGNSVINTSLTEAETLELQRLAEGADVLEIGSAYGYSTVAIGLVARSIVAVDPHLTHGSLGDLARNLRDNGITGKVDIRVGRSQDVLPQIHEDGQTFDLVWIDGDHTADVVEHDIGWARRLLRYNADGVGIIACHDYGEVTCPGVRAAIDKVYCGPGKLTDTLSVHYEFVGIGSPA